jgi:hypothetical protein
VDTDADARNHIHAEFDEMAQGWETMSRIDKQIELSRLHVLGDQARALGMNDLSDHIAGLRGEIESSIQPPFIPLHPSEPHGDIAMGF